VQDSIALHECLWMRKFHLSFPSFSSDMQIEILDSIQLKSSVDNELLQKTCINAYIEDTMLRSHPVKLALNEHVYLPIFSK
jgi:hypothetical protein